MTDYIISVLASDAIWQEDPEQPGYNPQPRPSVLMAEYESREAYLTIQPVGEWPASAYIVGAWDRDTGLQAGQSYDNGSVVGTPTHALHPDYLAHIRPLGNDSGRATGQLDSLRWQGMPEQKYVEDDSRYPADDSPFQLKIERVDHSPANPAWGWKVTMLSADPLRDITARAIGVYSDPEATNYLYTTGAFILDGSEYVTECPVGRRTATPEQVNFALLLGSVQEGFFSLPEGSSTTEALFWSHDQGDAGGVPDWDGSAVAYTAGDHVMYNGTEYVCLQSHTSQPGWTPEAVPALWSAV